MQFCRLGGNQFNCHYVVSSEAANPVIQYLDSMTNLLSLTPPGKQGALTNLLSLTPPGKQGAYLLG